MYILNFIVINSIHSLASSEIQIKRTRRITIEKKLSKNDVFDYFQYGAISPYVLSLKIQYMKNKNKK